MPDTRASVTLSERLDRLPFTRKHLRVLTGSGLGWALDAMDVGLISFIIAALAVQWNLQPRETAWIASVGFIGMAIGASVGGLLADRFGRRQVFAVTLLVYGLATGASALVGGLAALLVLRFLVGLGLGAELPGRVDLRQRVRAGAHARPADRDPRGLLGRRLDGRGAHRLPRHPGLRERLALGVRARRDPRRVRPRRAVGTARVRALARAPRSARRGGAGRALASRRRPVRRTGRRTAIAPPSRRAAAASSARERLAALWSAEFRVRTACLWLVWFCVNFSYYGAFIWIPSILVAQGYDLVRSFGFTLIITLAQLPGYAVAAWLIEVWGRRLTLSVFLVGSAVAAVFFGTATAESAVIAAGMALSFFNLGAWGALYAVTPEMYPTSLRATGSGWAAGVGRIASIVAPLTVPLLLAAGGAPTLFIVFAAFFASPPRAAWGLVDRRGLALDDR